VRCAASGSASGAPEREVAVRGGTRLVARLAHVPLGAGIPPPPATDATHLVTGGFGAIGTHVARRLVARGARRVALLGRTALPPRAAWSGVEPTTPVGRRIAAVRDLEAAGAAVHLIVADVGQADRLRAALDAFAAEGWPAVRSVHHTAAVFGGELLGELDAATLDAQLRPKLVGTCALVGALGELDELVLYSSIAALLPMPGQAGYAAGNAFLDAIADHLGACGRKALSVQWGFWDGSSDDLDGEAGQPDAHDAATFKDAARQMAEACGMRGFAPERGLDVLDRLLAGDAHRAMVVPVDWSGWGTARAGRPMALVADLVASAAPPTAAAPHGPTLREQLAAAPPADHGDLVEATVRRLLGQVLKQPEARIDGTQPFGAMGLDSLMAVELRNRLETATQLTLSATLAWNHPCVRDLSAHLLERLAGTAAPESSTAASLAVDPSPAAARGRVDELTVAVAELSEDDALGALLGEAGA
jgi:myxalamid-type polyketide synthase MxaE and MxaD